MSWGKGCWGKSTGGHAVRKRRRLFPLCRTRLCWLHPGTQVAPLLPACPTMGGMPVGLQLGHVPGLLCEDDPLGLGKDPLGPMSS